MPHARSSRRLDRAGPRSSGITDSVCSMPPRRTTICAGLPIGRPRRIWLTGGSCSAKRASISAPLTRTSSSPAFTAALSAGDPAATQAISAPLPAGAPTSGCTSKPSQLRRTWPSLISASTTAFARSLGIAPASPKLISLMPTISPARFTSGPPELPGKIAASCPIHRTIVPTSSPSSVMAVRNMRGMTSSVLLMTPSVTDCETDSGLPIASTGSPRDSVDDRPKRATGNVRGLAGRSFSTAISDRGSVPIRSAGTSSRSGSVQMIRRVRPAT